MDAALDLHLNGWIHPGLEARVDTCGNLVLATARARVDEVGAGFDSGLEELSDVNAKGIADVEDSIERDGVDAVLDLHVERSIQASVMSEPLCVRPRSCLSWRSRRPNR